MCTSSADPHTNQGDLSSVSLRALAATIASRRHALISTDLFDTVLLRDHTIEDHRLATACRRVAPDLGVDARALTRLRWSLQSSAYRAVSIERPTGEASLAAICRTATRAFGLDDAAAELLRRSEVDVEIEHLSPNRRLLALLDQAAGSGLRVVALSDTYLDPADLRRILDAVVGPHPIAQVYSSAELGLTKHAGGAYGAVAAREGVAPEAVLHVGDNYAVDVSMAGRARWDALHLRPERWRRARKGVGKLLAVPTKVRAVR